MVSMINPKNLKCGQRVRTLRAQTISVMFLLFLVIWPFLTSTGCTKDEKISIPRDYSEWQRTTTIELDYPIPGHENNYRIIYINAIGEDPRVENQEGKKQITFPKGTIIVKEIYSGFDYTPGDKPAMLTVMVKAPDDPSNRGGWLWIVQNEEEGTQRVLDSEFCITCHTNANEEHPYGDNNPNEEFRDYVFFLPKEP